MSKIRLHGSSLFILRCLLLVPSGNNTLTLPNDGTIISKDSNGAVGVTSITVGTGVTIKSYTAVTIGESGVNVVGVVTASSGIVGLTSTGLSFHQLFKTLRISSGYCELWFKLSIGLNW